MLTPTYSMYIKKIFFLFFLLLIFGGNSVYALESSDFTKQSNNLKKTVGEVDSLILEKESSVINIVRREPQYFFPTEVPTGVTGNGFLDYFLLPLLLSILIFIVFKKQIIAFTKRLERAREGAKED